MKDKKRMVKPPENYVILEELGSDSIGTIFRVVEVSGSKKPLKHYLMTEVYPFLFNTPEEWNRTEILFQRHRESGIKALYAPEKIIKNNDGIFLMYPHIEGKSLAQIMEDATEKKKTLSFNLSFSTVFAIASLIEMGSTIRMKEQTVFFGFHGFLTPDHIFIDYSGNIYLKYFELWPLMGGNDVAISEMIRKYASWLTPEFIRREKIIQRSDFYHLGYIIYRMLTGNYFSYLPGEDFESTFTSISFITDLPSTDIGFLTSFIDVFKKTLNPDVNKRFGNIKEFKLHIAKYLNQGDLDELENRLKAYMEQLYSDTMEAEKKRLEVELSAPVQEWKSARLAEQEDLMSDVPIGLEKKRSSKVFYLVLIAVLVLILGVAGYWANKVRKEKLEAVSLLEKQNKEKSEFQQQLQEVQQKLKTLEVGKTQGNDLGAGQTPEVGKDVTAVKTDSKTVESTVDKKTPADKNKNPEQKSVELKDSKKAGVESAKAVTAPVMNSDQGNKESQDQKVKSTETVKTPPVIKASDNTDKKEVPKKEEVKAALVSLNEVSVKPQQVSGKEPEFSEAMRKTYAGRRATVKANLSIDEYGNVTQVELLEKGEIPAEIQIVVRDTLRQWKFKPAFKGDMRVKVIWPVKFKIVIKSDE